MLVDLSQKMEQHTPEFALCLQSAIEHIGRKFQDPLRSWLKTDLVPPFLEHFSFRFGNQIFYVLCEDIDSAHSFPSNRANVLNLATVSDSIPCVMPMACQNGQWAPVASDWGLVDLRTGANVNPLDLITNERIRMTDAELYSVVTEYLKERFRSRGAEIIFANPLPPIEPSVDPAFWYSDADGIKTITFRAVRYPALFSELPHEWDDICAVARKKSLAGTFVSFGFMHANDPDSPIIRDEAFHMYVDYFTHDKAIIEEIKVGLTKIQEHYRSVRDEQILYTCNNCEDLDPAVRVILKTEAQRRHIRLSIDSILKLNGENISQHKAPIERIEKDVDKKTWIERHPFIFAIISIIILRSIYGIFSRG